MSPNPTDPSARPTVEPADAAVAAVTFPELGAGLGPGAPRPLEAAGALPIDVSVQLGTCRRPAASLAALRPGDVVTLDGGPEDPATIVIGGRACAHGELVGGPDGSVSVRVTGTIHEPSRWSR